MTPTGYLRGMEARMGGHLERWRREREAERQLQAMLMQLRSDAVASPLTGLGVLGRDKARDARPGAVAWLGQSEMQALVVSDGIMHRLTWGMAGDIVGDGCEVHRDGGDGKEPLDILDRLRAMERMTYAIGSARALGGCHLLMVPEKGQADDVDLSQPRPARPIRLAALQPIDATEATAETWCSDLRSEAWSRPELWSVTPIRTGISIPTALARVHRSWMIYVPGLPVTLSMQRPVLQGYQLSACQVYWESLCDLGLAHRSAALAAMVQSVLYLAADGSGLSGRSGEPAGGGDYTRSIRTMQATLSALGVAFTIGGDKLSRLEAPLTGLDTIIRAQYDRLAAPEGVPLTRLLGQAPAGMSTDDASGQRTYNDFRRRQRRYVCDPIIRTICEVEMGPGRYDIDWTPLDVPSAAELASGETSRATALSTLVSAGIWTADEAAEVYRGRPSPTLRLPEVEEVPVSDLAEVQALLDLMRPAGD